MTEKFITWRDASSQDIGQLAEWNHQLIRDEGHRNAMTVEQLAERMRGWLGSDYHAVIFSDREPFAYALFRPEPDHVYLRQFFVAPNRRREGLGRAAIAVLREQIWPRDVRLTVDVLSANTRGVAFWRSVGYTDYAITMEIMPEQT